MGAALRQVGQRAQPRGGALPARSAAELAPAERAEVALARVVAALAAEARLEAALDLVTGRSRT
jgi:hypothetical protein